MPLRGGTTRTLLLLAASLFSVAILVARGESTQDGEPRFTKANGCTAEREWSGVIRYSFTAEPKSTTRAADSSAGGRRGAEEADGIGDRP